MVFLHSFAASLHDPHNYVHHPHLCRPSSFTLVAIPLLSIAAPHEYPLPSCSFSARHLRVTVFCGRGFQTLPTATPCYIMLFRSWHFALDPLFSDLPRKASRQRGVCVDHLNRCKTSMFLWFFTIIHLQQQGAWPLRGIQYCKAFVFS